MRFQIISIDNKYLNDFMQKYGKILEKYHVEYVKEDKIEGDYEDYCCLHDEDFDDDIYVFIKIYTLNELLALKKELDTDLVLRDGIGKDVEVIEIYDGYRE